MNGEEKSETDLILFVEVKTIAFFISFCYSVFVLNYNTVLAFAL